MSQPPIPAPSARSIVTTWPGPASRTSSWPSMSRSQPLGLVEPAGVGVGQVLGGDQVLVGREAHVADVDPAEQAVPVAVVRLALVEVVEGARPVRRPAAIASTLSDVRSICLCRSLISRYLHLEVAPERAAQPARLGPMLRPARGMERVREDHGSRRAGSAHSPISAYEPVGM